MRSPKGLSGGRILVEAGLFLSLALIASKSLGFRSGDDWQANSHQTPSE
jgi:hypothetical protein